MSIPCSSSSIRGGGCGVSGGSNGEEIKCLS